MKKLKWITMSFALFLVAYHAYAENVTITTYYPSPSGIYQTLTTTAATYLSTTSGVVGIGTAVPAGTGAKMDIQGGSLAIGGQSVLNASAGSVLLGDLSAGDGNLTTLDLRTSNTTRVRVDTNGNVAIGNNMNPSYKLDVSGDAYVSGNLRLRDSSGNQGNLRVSCNGTDCYAVYAP